MYGRLFRGTAFAVNSWDLMLGIGVLVATTLLVLYRPKDFTLSRWGLIGCCLLMLYMALLGAKILHIMLHWDKFAGRPVTEILPAAGSASLGALVFELLAILAVTKLRFNRKSFLKTADFFAPFMFLQLAFVRIGCFLTGCCHGTPSNMPWAYSFKSTYPVTCHPTQIYSVMFLIPLFFIGRYVYKKHLTPGITLFSVLFLYGFFRFSVEFFRADGFQVYGPFNSGQVALLSISILSAAILVILSRRRS